MTRLLPLLLALAGCASPDRGSEFDPAQQQAALQRMRFAVEAVCLNNRSRDDQDRVARSLGFPIRERQDGGINYVNPSTLTFLRLAPAGPQTVALPGGGTRDYSGQGCSVGSPAVNVDMANRLVGEILAPRLVEGDSSVALPVAAGVNEARGAGLFFDDLAITVPLGTTTITNDGGEGVRFVHPVILIVHGGR